MRLEWWNRWLALLTVLLSPALAYAAQANPEVAERSWGWGWLWIVIVAVVVAMLFSAARGRGRPPTARRL
jgi:hypothetical protein